MFDVERDPIHDPERLVEIASSGLLQREPAPHLKAALETAADRLGLPVALVSLVLEDAQFFAASHGLSGWLAQANGTPLEWSFCINAVRSRRPFVVEDAAMHPLVADNPLVTQDGVGCYAGVPLRTRKGHTLGALCVLGPQPRHFSDEDIELLLGLADEVMHSVEGTAHAEAA